MSDAHIRPVLSGQKALVIGVANDQSIAYGCAKAFHTVGAELAITWLNERARPYVEPLAQELGADHRRAGCVRPGPAGGTVRSIRTEWGRLDILVHSIAFAPKEDLQGGLLNCSAEGFAQGNGRVLPLLRPHGEACGAADDGRRHHVRDELLRRQPGRGELQRDGAGEGGAGGGLPLSRL